MGTLQKVHIDPQRSAYCPSAKCVLTFSVAYAVPFI